MSSPPVIPNHAPIHDTGDLGHPRSQGGDSQYNFATIPAGWGIRCLFRDLYFYLHFGIPFSYQSRIQRVMDTTHLSYSDLKLLMALNARNREQRGRVFGDIKAWLGFLVTLEDWDRLTGSFPQRSMKLKLNPNSDEVTPLPSQIPLPGTRPSRTSSGGDGRLALTEPLERFHNEWKIFVKNINNEWTTLNIISALMVTAGLSLVQIDAAVANPTTRSFVFLTLLASMTSLLLGCFYTLRFSNMKPMRKAARWVEHSQLNADNVVWNIWVLLSLPAVWLAWAAVDFSIAIFMLLWTIVPSMDNPNDGPLDTSHYADIFGPRIVVTATWAISVFHFSMVFKTFLAWSEAGNSIEFDERRLEGGDSETVPEPIRLPSGLQRIPNAQHPPVTLQTAALVPSIRAEIPVAREDDEEGIPMACFTPKALPMDRL